MRAGKEFHLHTPTVYRENKKTAVCNFTCNMAPVAWISLSFHFFFPSHLQSLFCCVAFSFVESVIKLSAAQTSRCHRKLIRHGSVTFVVTAAHSYSYFAHYQQLLVWVLSCLFFVHYVSNGGDLANFYKVFTRLPAPLRCGRMCMYVLVASSIYLHYVNASALLAVPFSHLCLYFLANLAMKLRELWGSS